MPTIFIRHYFVIFDPGFPLDFAFLFPYNDDWVILVPQGHQLLVRVEDPTVPFTLSLCASRLVQVQVAL